MSGERKGDDGRRRERGNDGGASENHQFLDLEMSRVLLDQASRAAREGFRQLLLERVKERLSEKLGDQIDALAALAVDDLVADIEANVDIEQRILSRADLRADHARKLAAIFGEGGGEE